MPCYPIEDQAQPWHVMWHLELMGRLMNEPISGTQLDWENHTRGMPEDNWKEDR